MNWWWWLCWWLIVGGGEVFTECPVKSGWFGTHCRKILRFGFYVKPKDNMFWERSVNLTPPMDDPY